MKTNIVLVVVILWMGGLLFRASNHDKTHLLAEEVLLNRITLTKVSPIGKPKISKGNRVALCQQYKSTYKLASEEMQATYVKACK